MEEDNSQLLTLFDFFWFHHHVLLDTPLPAVPLPAHDPDPAADAAGAIGEPRVPEQNPVHRRSLSEELAFASSSDSALLTHQAHKLQTIFSGKPTFEDKVEHRGVAAQSGSRTDQKAAEGDEINKGHRERRKHRERRRRTRGTSKDGKSKSLSELEFEELKGFMDLGFTFSEAESDERLLSIVPGLQRRARRWASEEEAVSEEAEEGEGGIDEPSVVSRPYLSEAWDVADHQESRRSHAHDFLLRKWRVPAAGDGVDMKHHLRSWAHTVASAVR